MDIGKVGIWAMLEAMTARETLDFATIEEHDYRALWIPEGPGRDPFAHSAYLLSHTESLVIATGIANIWARATLLQWLLRRELSLRFPTDVSYWELA